MAQAGIRAAVEPHPLVGGGELGARMRALDWSRTAVGPVERWPQSLRTAVSICLGSRYPIFITWGRPEYTLFYNDAYARIMGSKHPQWLGRSFPQCWADVWGEVGPLAEHVMDTGEATWSEDLQLVMDRHGYLEETYFTFSYSPIREEGGRVAGMFCAVIEVTGRVLGERRLRTLRELGVQARTAEEAAVLSVRALANNARDVPFALVYLADADGALRLAGRTGLPAGHPACPERIEAGARSPWPMAAALGAGREEVALDLARRFELPREPWPEPAPSALLLPLQGGGQERAAGVLIAGVSARRPLDQPYRDFLGLVAAKVAGSIESARAWEAERKRAEALAELDRAKTAFFSNVSHEFRTPLTLMLGPLEDVLRAGSGVGKAERAQLEVVQRNALRLLKLVNTLLDFSRLEAGRVQASFEPVDLAEATADLASVFRSAVERAGLQLRVDCPPLPEPVWVDRDLWEKIVLNLLSNALKYTLQGHIAVSLRAAGRAVELRVEDTGAGIPAHELPRLFERFHRVQGAVGRTQEGSGIGLALVQELSRLHGGSVRVESEAGKGSAFTVALRLGNAHLPRERLAPGGGSAGGGPGTNAFVEEALRWGAPSEAVSLIAEPGGAAAAQQRPRILLADDNADMRDYLGRLLSSRWEVEACGDGLQALAAARARPPHLIVGDVMMPGLDGFGLLREVRSDPALREVPVLLLSARAGEEAQVEGRAAGADDYVVKPFSARELLARVQSLLALAQLRRVEQARLQELRRLFMDAPVVMCLLRGPQHVYALANAAYLRVVGRDAVEGKAIRDALPELEGQGIFEALDEVYRTGQPRTGNEHRVKLRRAGDGLAGDRFFNFTFQPFHDALGKVAGILVLGHDVTDMVVARRNVQELAEKAQLADRRKDEFLAMLGHELRNPLAPIGTAVELMKLRGTGGERERLVIERQVGHLSRLVDDLLDVSRIARSKIELQRRSVEVAEIAAKAIEMASPLLEQRSQQLVVRVPREGLRVDGDPTRLSQVLSNLLTNAARYTPPRGHIALEARRHGQQVELSVTDDGIGISPQLMPTIFDLFVQGERGLDRGGGGLGLGLSLVKSLVQLHGGSVEAFSAGRDCGSRFVVRLPALDPAHAVPDAIAPSTRAAPGAGKRVLLVDDNADAVELLAEALRCSGHEVRVANDGARALALLRAFDAEVGVLDLGLPVMDGYELARQIAAQHRARPLRLVALTGYGQENDRARSLEAGFERHLVKPVELEAVLAAVDGEDGDA